MEIDVEEGSQDAVWKAEFLLHQMKLQNVLSLSMTWGIDTDIYKYAAGKKGKY